MVFRNIRKNPSEQERENELQRIAQMDASLFSKLMKMKGAGKNSLVNRAIDASIKKRKRQEEQKRKGIKMDAQMVTSNLIRAVLINILKGYQSDLEVPAPDQIIQRLRESLSLERFSFSPEQINQIEKTSKDFGDLAISLRSGKWVYDKAVIRVASYTGDLTRSRALEQISALIQVLLTKDKDLKPITTRNSLKTWNEAYKENKTDCLLLPPVVDFLLVTLLYQYPERITLDTLRPLHDFTHTEANLWVSNIHSLSMGSSSLTAFSEIRDSALSYTPPAKAVRGFPERLAAMLKNIQTYKKHFNGWTSVTDKKIAEGNYTIISSILKNIDTFTHYANIESPSNKEVTLRVPQNMYINVQVREDEFIPPYSRSFEIAGNVARDSGGSPYILASLPQNPYVYIRFRDTAQYTASIDCDRHNTPIKALDYLHSYLIAQQFRTEIIWYDSRRRKEIKAENKKSNANRYLKVPTWSLGVVGQFIADVLGDSANIAELENYFPYWTFGSYALSDTNSMPDFIRKWEKGTSEFTKWMNDKNLKELQETFTNYQKADRDEFSRSYEISNPAYRPFYVAKFLDQSDPLPANVDKFHIILRKEDKTIWFILPKNDRFANPKMMGKFKRRVEGIGAVPKDELSVLALSMGGDFANMVRNEDYSSFSIDLVRTIEQNVHEGLQRYAQPYLAGMLSEDAIRWFRVQCNVSQREVTAARRELIKPTAARDDEIERLWRKKYLTGETREEVDNAFANLFVFLGRDLRENIEAQRNTGESGTEISLKKFVNYLMFKKVTPLRVQEAREDVKEPFSVDLGVDGGAFRKTITGSDKAQKMTLDVAYSLYTEVDGSPEAGEPILKIKDNPYRFADFMAHSIGGLGGGRSKTNYVYSDTNLRQTFAAPYAYIRIKVPQIARFCRALDQLGQDAPKLQSQLLLLSTAIRLAFLLDPNFRDCSDLDAFNNASSIEEIDNKELREKALENWELLKEILSPVFKRTMSMPKKYREMYDQVVKEAEEEVGLQKTTSAFNYLIMEKMEKEIADQNPNYTDVAVEDTMDSEDFSQRRIELEDMSLYVEFPVEPYDYQKVGISFADHLGYRCVIGDDMGLGKTVQGIGAMALSFMQGSPTFPCLILAPTSVVGNWKDEVEQWLTEGKQAEKFRDQILIIDGKVRNDPQIAERLKNAKIHISGYRGFSLMLEKAEDNEALKEVIFGSAGSGGLGGYKFMIMDEMHRGKNFKSGVGGALLRMAEDENLKLIGLTGTLLENRIMELYVPFHMFDKQRFPTKEQFKTTFAIGKDNYGKLVSALTPDEQQELARLSLQCFQIRRFKNQALQGKLPSKTRVQRKIWLDREAQAQYEDAFAQLPFLAFQTRLKKAFRLFRSIMGGRSRPTTKEAIAEISQGVGGADAHYPPLTEAQIARLVAGSGAQALTYLLRVIGTHKSVMAIDWLRLFFKSQKQPVNMEIPTKYLFLLLDELILGNPASGRGGFPYINALNDVIVDFNFVRDISMNKNVGSQLLLSDKSKKIEITEKDLEDARQLLERLKLIYQVAFFVSSGRNPDGSANYDAPQGQIERRNLASTWVFNEIEKIKVEFNITKEWVKSAVIKKERLKPNVEKFEVAVLREQVLTPIGGKSSQFATARRQFEKVGFNTYSTNYQDWSPPDPDREISERGTADLMVGIMKAQRKEQPVVVFVKYLKVFDTIAKALEDEGISYTTIRGDVATKKRTERVKEFQDGKYQVFLANQSAREGITLTNASQMLFVELWYVPARIEQAEDRIWRIGQDNDVSINYLIVQHGANYEQFPSVDVKVWNIIQRKRLLIDSIMGLEDVGESDVSQLYTWDDEELVESTFEDLLADISAGSSRAADYNQLMGRSFDGYDVADFLGVPIQSLIKKQGGRTKDQWDDDKVRMLLFPDPIKLFNRPKPSGANSPQGIFLRILEDELERLTDQLPLMQLKEPSIIQEGEFVDVEIGDILPSKQDLDLTDEKYEEMENLIFVPAIRKAKASKKQKGKKTRKLSKSSLYMWTEGVMPPVSAQYLQMVQQAMSGYFSAPSVPMFELLGWLNEMEGKQFETKHAITYLAKLAGLINAISTSSAKELKDQRGQPALTRAGREHVLLNNNGIFTLLSTDNLGELDPDRLKEIKDFWKDIKKGKWTSRNEISSANRIVGLFEDFEEQYVKKTQLKGTMQLQSRRNPSALLDAEKTVDKLLRHRFRENNRLVRSRKNPSVARRKTPVGGHREGEYVVSIGSQPVGIIHYTRSSASSPLALAMKQYGHLASPQKPISVAHEHLSSPKAYGIALQRSMASENQAIDPFRKNRKKRR